MVIGGRTSPSNPLSDAWLLHLPSMKWNPISTDVIQSSSSNSNASNGNASSTKGSSCRQTEQCWPPRYRHSAVCDPTLTTPLYPHVCSSSAENSDHSSSSSSGVGGAAPGDHTEKQVSCSVLVFGGCDAHAVLDDLWVLRVPIQRTQGAAALGGAHDSASCVDPDPQQLWTWVQLPHNDQTSSSSTSATATNIHTQRPQHPHTATCHIQHTLPPPPPPTHSTPLLSPTSTHTTSPTLPPNDASHLAPCHTTTTIAAGTTTATTTTTITSNSITGQKYIQQPPQLSPSAWPSPRKSHAAAVLHGRMYLHGGTAEYGGQSCDMFVMDLQVCVCVRVCVCVYLHGGTAEYGGQSCDMFLMDLQVCVCVCACV